MTVNRFVAPRTKRFDLPDGSGDWIEIKHELPLVDERGLQGAGTGFVNAKDDESGETKQEMTLDWGRYSVERLAAWLVDWSFVDGAGQRQKVNRSSIRALRPNDAKMIEQIIDDHKGALEAEKKGLSEPAAPETPDPALEEASQPG